jgi:thymidylate synthase (FAD)
MKLEYYKPEVKVISVSKPVVDFIPDSEDLISYCARVSNPDNQENFETADRLLAYCAKHGHWSVFEMANAVLEIKAPRDISRQILRHKSSKFQEYSQRYAEVTDQMFTLRECRVQDTSNRQNSYRCTDPSVIEWWYNTQQEVIAHATGKYFTSIKMGIAKEQARCLLPEGLTMSNMYMNGSMREWLHYCGLRQGNGTQKEHSDVAIACKEALREYFPNLVKLIGEE